MENEVHNNKVGKNHQKEGGKTVLKKQILVVEDDRSSVLYYQELAKIMDIPGVELFFHYVSSGEEAVDYCRKNPLDLVLMDIKLSGMNGWEAARKIKAEEPQIVIIAQTAYGLSGDYKKSFEAGCDDHLLKPIDSKDFIQTLYKYLRKP